MSTEAVSTAVEVAVLVVMAVAVTGLVAYRFPVVRRGLVAAGMGLVRAWWVIWVWWTWAQVCESAGLGQRQQGVTLSGETKKTVRVPRLMRVRTSAYAFTLKVRTRRGQALAELEAASPKIAASYGAASFRVYPNRRRKGNTVHMELVKRDLIAKPRTATGIPDRRQLADGCVRLGRRAAGTPFTVQLFGRQTLVVGASGSGKGSYLQGAVVGLAPLVADGLVELWGIDLKGGMELAFCEPLLARRAYNLRSAVDRLGEMVDEIDRRTDEMRGKQRSHTLSRQWPGLLLLADELAMVTRIGDPALIKIARTRLQSILTRGRAVGVVALAFIQDPRKEVLPDRGLFTQTIALRLRSAEEVAMTLGEGMAESAPAHRIPSDAPGTGYLIDEDGTIDRVRADFWPDHLIREVADTYGYHPEPGREHTVTADLFTIQNHADGEDPQRGSGPGTGPEAGPDTEPGTGAER